MSLSGDQPEPPPPRWDDKGASFPSPCPCGADRGRPNGGLRTGPSLSLPHSCKTCLGAQFLRLDVFEGCAVAHCSNIWQIPKGDTRFIFDLLNYSPVSSEKFSSSGKLHRERTGRVWGGGRLRRRFGGHCLFEVFNPPHAQTCQGPPPTKHIEWHPRDLSPGLPCERSTENAERRTQPNTATCSNCGKKVK